MSFAADVSDILSFDESSMLSLQVRDPRLTEYVLTVPYSQIILLFIPYRLVAEYKS